MQQLKKKQRGLASFQQIYFLGEESFPAIIVLLLISAKSPLFKAKSIGNSGKPAPVQD